MGLSAATVPVTLEITPKSLDFGIVRAGRLKGPRYVTIRNPAGNRKKPGFTVTMQGERRNGPFIKFSVTNNCPPTLSRVRSARLESAFAPDARESWRGSLLIFDNAQYGPQSVSLKGNGK